jgi:lipopolysaccharide transport system ATP-binding protein
MAENAQIQSNKAEVLVTVEGLSKKFCKDLKTSLWYGVKDLVSGLGSNTRERELRPKEFWAVKDISFELRRGECLGLIGHNGAGKSTLLKMLNGLINPDSGKITIKGRVGALIELGAGFSPILSGRENIYNNGAILGFTKKEIDAKLEEIIAFAELEEFIDMPVQNYSSGMKVRLGFAVAAQMEPDVLIIDEVLAVGDLAFRMKCYNKIMELLSSTAIIFVSHSMPQISKITTICLLLKKGAALDLSNDIPAVINKYLIENKTEKKYSVIGNVELLPSKINSNLIAKQKEYVFTTQDKIKLELNIKLNDSAKLYIIRMIVYDKEFKGIVEINSLFDNIIFKNTGKINSHKLSFENPLNSGYYNMSLMIIEIMNDGRWGERLLVVEGFLNFKVINTKFNYESYIPLSIHPKWNEIY